MTFKVFVPISGMQEIVNDPLPHSAHDHSFVLEKDYLVLRDALEQIQKEVRGLNAGERKGYLLAVIERVQKLTRSALTVEASHE